MHVLQYNLQFHAYEAFFCRTPVPQNMQNEQETKKKKKQSFTNSKTSLCWTHPIPSLALEAWISTANAVEVWGRNR